MRNRQVHLDFHTSEHITGIGAKFDKQQFQNALKAGRVGSITLFAKCHHGFMYYPSAVSPMHPHLSFDLLSAQIEAAKEIGVGTPVYISAGLDERIANKEEGWLVRNKDGSTLWVNSFTVPGYHQLCFNSPYLDLLISQVKEMLNTFDCDGLFMDIASVTPCYCAACRELLKEEGKSIFDDEAVCELAEKTYFKYTDAVKAAVDAIKPGLPIFHNGGHIIRGRRDIVATNTNIEIESLPTGAQWTYDHFPLSAAYARTLGKKYLSQTGRFHTTWGEFGGYKHPNALKYETSLAIANGACCLVGDQLHPNGEMDVATYKLIGSAYEYIEKCEPWCGGEKFVADIGVLSSEAVNSSNKCECAKSDRYGRIDAGVLRILTEGQYLFNVIDMQEDFSAYKLLVLPDIIRLSDELLKKLKAYIAAGGKILASGESGLAENEDTFLLDLGAEYIGLSEYSPVYVKPDCDLPSLQSSYFVTYTNGYTVQPSGEKLGDMANPYFNRTAEHFCSHLHSPVDPTPVSAAITQGADGIYLAWSVFQEYYAMGTLAHKQIVHQMINRLIDKTADVKMPAQGKITLAHRSEENQYVLHLLYGAPVKRGAVEVIEDLPAICEISCRLQMKEPKKIYLAPSKENIPFKISEGMLEFCIPRLECHQIAVIQY